MIEDFASPMWSNKELDLYKYYIMIENKNNTN